MFEAPVVDRNNPPSITYIHRHTHNTRQSARVLATSFNTNTAERQRLQTQSERSRNVYYLFFTIISGEVREHYNILESLQDAGYVFEEDTLRLNEITARKLSDLNYHNHFNEL